MEHFLQQFLTQGTDFYILFLLPGGSFSAERKNNTVATVYSDVQNDGANSKCKVKPNPPSPYLLYVNKKVGSNIDESSLSWSETRLMWTRTVLQWSPPHQGPNGLLAIVFII